MPEKNDSIYNENTLFKIDDSINNHISQKIEKGIVEPINNELCKNKWYHDSNLKYSQSKYSKLINESYNYIKQNETARDWNPKETHVPSTAISRFGNYASLGMKMIGGTIAESTRKNLNKSNNQRSSLLSDYNLSELSTTLRKMRGVALKLGQFISMQDERDMVSKELIAALESARQHADIMPKTQLQDLMNKELGSGWQEKYFEQFDDKPFAAASIGQVHNAILKDGKQTRVAVKIQFPGVAESIDSDLNTLKRFLIFGNFMPKGLFIEELIYGIRNELKNECDYLKEAKSQMIVQNHLINDLRFKVPTVIENLTTTKVLTTTYEEGFTFDQIKNINVAPEIRSRIGYDLLELCMREIFVMRIMQSDPNPANFKFQFVKDKNGSVVDVKIVLLDFGSTLEISKDFMQKYFDVVYSSVQQDYDRCYTASKNIGFLTGMERKEMIETWCTAMQSVGEPFSQIYYDKNQMKSYDFTKSKTTNYVSEKGKIWANHRLKPPPKEIYTLHRKLAGAFLFNINLQANINCIEMYKQICNDSIALNGETELFKSYKL
eukprot:Mrub_02377.p1 GENE.Mrub_02377~~Mrub_02377.p1  ORF type:complete len:570 (-),score=68.87 Mrub_02377:25-1674(-)